jgi:tetratricopeptide (TPR) repeat protein
VLTKDTLSIALKHHQAGALHEAERLYREILALEPRHADALHLLGVIANQIGKPELAVQLIGEAIEINPLVTAYHNNFANAAKACGDLAKAEASYQDAIELDQKNADAHHNLGTLLEEQRRWKEARRSYETALRYMPTMTRALVSLGRIAGAMGETKLAVKYSKAAVRSAPKHAAAHNVLGNALLLEGKQELAKASYLCAIKVDANFADAHYNVGNLYRQQKDDAAAVDSYRHAIELSPLQADVYNSLGAVLADMGQTEEANKAFLRALELDPSYAEAYFNLGSELAKDGEHDRAIEYLLKAVALRPNYAKAYHNLGVSQQALGDFAAATTAYRRALACKPEDANTYSHMGTALVDMGQPEAAVEAFARAVELHPSCAEAYFNLGSALAQSGDTERAIEHFHTAIDMRPDYAKTYQNLGVAQQALGNLDAAISAYRRALVCQPGDVDVRSNLASVLILRGDDEGITLFEELLEEEPNSGHIHWNFSVALLMQGNYARGWREYEWRRQWDKFPSPKREFSQPHWQGEALEGARIFLHCEQGFGDTLQFTRYVPLVAGRGGRVILEVQPGLYYLLKGMEGVDQCIRQGDPLPEFDCYCSLMSLPLMFGTTMETIPPMIPLRYGGGGGDLFAASGEGRSLKVGLVWAGNPKHASDLLRSIPLRQFLPLTEVDSVSLISLQKGPAAVQINEGYLPFTLPDPLASVTDFTQTGAVVAGLDLVITVDTAVAHLAATMGKPVWMLISHLPDWRWGLHSETTPWYPTVRIFRQSYTGGWEELMKRVASELALFVSSKKKEVLEVGAAE